MGLVFPATVLVQAATTLPDLPQNIDLLTTIAAIANLLFWILLAISVVMIVYAGILFVTASGKTEQVEQARHIILYAIIGIIVAAAAYAIRAFLIAQLIPAP